MKRAEDVPVEDQQHERGEGSSAPGRAKFYYIKSSIFRVVHVDGVIGGMSPNARYLNLNLWSERLPVPRETVQIVNADGSLGEEVKEKRVSKDGIIRELEVSAMMDIRTARSIANWILMHAEQAEAMQKRAMMARSQGASGEKGDE